MSQRSSIFPLFTSRVTFPVTSQTTSPVTFSVALPMVLLIAWLTAFYSSVAAARSAEVFHPRMDVASWESDSSLLVCRIRQSIPFMGVAEFETWSGSEVQFQLNSERPASPQNGSTLQLWVEAPRWNPDHPTTPLGEVALNGDNRVPITLGRDRSRRMLAELYRGGSIRLQGGNWFGAEQALTEVGLSPVSFRAAYKEYNRCLAELMPVGFDKLERSRIHFDSDLHELNAVAVDWLQQLASFLSRSPEVEMVYIDGHTDNTNTTTYNVELSRKRAETVHDFLTQQGVKSSQIVVRYHGERFPVESNNNAWGKAANRRVTIRLEMAPGADLPS